MLLVNIALDGSNSIDWSTRALKDRPAVAMKRLAARGLTPSTPGLQFAMLFGQGEAEVGLGTSQANYAVLLAVIRANLLAAGFVGRMFINVQTCAAGVVNAAQAAFAMARMCLSEEISTRLMPPIVIMVASGSPY